MRRDGGAIVGVEGCGCAGMWDQLDKHGVAWDALSIKAGRSSEFLWDCGKSHHGGVRSWRLVWRRLSSSPKDIYQLWMYMSKAALITNPDKTSKVIESLLPLHEERSAWMN